MQYQRREPVPDILALKGKDWTDRYVARRKKDKGATLPWPKIPKKQREFDDETLHDRLVPILARQTGGCCSFCNRRPLEVDTIEHFYPKSLDESQAYKWSNLFLCCSMCQGAKGEDYDPRLLKPDTEKTETEEQYCFEDHFEWVHRTGDLRPLTEQADVTIKMYDLNNPKHSRVRRRLRELWKESGEGSVDDLSYPAYITAP